MSAAAPFVTHGSTPLCDACGEHYSERHCTDCDQHQCTWCNLDIHVPIGKRNHWRPRLYGTDPHAELERNATASADQAIEGAQRRAKGAQSSTRSGSAGSSGVGTLSGSSRPGEASMLQPYTVDSGSGRVNITTEHLLPLTAEEAWDLLGDWEAAFLPFPCDVSSSGDRRVLVLPPEKGAQDEPEDEDDYDDEDDEDDGDEEAAEARYHARRRSHVVTERLIQRSERDMFYSFSRTVAPEAAAAFPYTDLLSKYAFLPAAAASPATLKAAAATAAAAASAGGAAAAAAAAATTGAGGKRCVLQWTTSVLPREPITSAHRQRQAANAVARYQESWRAYFDAALAEED